jgi:hypothetical protein
MEKHSLVKWYTRIIGIFFTLVVISLIMDSVKFGFGVETMHKIFHVILGVIVLKIGWNNEKFWRPFALANGGFFTYVALVGWLFPNFGGLDAFNFVDTVLHSIVGLSGLVVGFWDKG